jgi:tripartite ATP-independent transporter DctM subunit
VLLLGLVLAVLILLLVRVPVAFALLIPSLGYILITDDFPLGAAIQRVTFGIDNFILLAVPLFLMAGTLATDTGVTYRLYDFVERVLGRFRGSHAYVNIGVSLIFSGMSGTATADVAATSRIEVPAMVRAGYPLPFSAGLSASSAIIGPLMPPSVPAVIYALTAGVSLGAMLLAGAVPSLIITVFLCAYVYVWVRRRPDIRRATRSSFREVATATRSAIPALLAPVILIGGILGGVATPTEVAAVAVFYMLLLGLIVYRTVSLRKLWATFVQAGEMTGSILLIVASAQLVAFILALERVPGSVAEFALGVTDNRYILLLVINVTLLVLGLFLEIASIIVVMVPVLLPVVTSLGIDPVHFGVIVVLNLMIGGMTPPVGLLIYILSITLEEEVSRITQGVLPYLIPMGFALIVITMVPALSLWLPGILGYSD